MPHDPTPSAITIIPELYFTDVIAIKIITDTDEWDLNEDTFNFDKISIRAFYNWLMYPYQTDARLIKVYFKDTHPFNIRYPDLKRAEFSPESLKQLLTKHGLLIHSDLTTPPPTL